MALVSWWHFEAKQNRGGGVLNVRLPRRGSQDHDGSVERWLSVAATLASLRVPVEPDQIVRVANRGLELARRLLCFRAHKPIVSLPACPKKRAPHPEQTQSPSDPFSRLRSARSSSGVLASRGAEGVDARPTTLPRRQMEVPMELRITVPMAGALAELFPPESRISHYVLDRCFERFQLREFDPRRLDPNAGKIKRVREVLTEAAHEDPVKGGQLLLHLVEQLKGAGEFPGLAQSGALTSFRGALRSAGFSIADDGTVAPLSLDGLSGRELTTALRVYVERARRGDADAPLVAGTAKDLVEATARHVLVERGGSYSESMGFQGTLHNAFAVVGMTPVGPSQWQEILKQLDNDPAGRLQQCIYLTALAANKLRQAEGTGHGRPQDAKISSHDAQIAAEAAALTSGAMLNRL